MKHIISIIIILSALSHLTFSQNLLYNWSFENGDFDPSLAKRIEELELKCTW